MSRTLELRRFQNMKKDMKGDTNTKMEQKWEDSRNTRKGKRNKNNK